MPKIKLFFLVFPFLYLFVILFSLNKTSFVTDEYAHFLTTTEIGQNKINDKTFTRNAQLPGYYYFMSIFSYLKPNITIVEFRFIQTILSLITIFIFYQTAKLINIKSAKTKTLEFLLFPYLSIFFVLFYNESFSLLFLLLSFYFLLKKNFKLSWITSLISIFIRQNNIIWIGFFCVYHFWQNYNFPITKSKLIKYFKETIGYLISFLVLVIFLMNTSGPAMADNYANPLAIKIENPIFFLFSFILLFLPTILTKINKTLSLIKNNPWIILIIVVLFPIYYIFFKADNWFNNPVFNFHLRNKLVNLVISSPKNKIIFYLISSLSIIFIPAIKLLKKPYYLIYPFSLIYLSLSWLIEPRYHIIPFIFLILFKIPTKKFPQIIQLIYFLILNILIIWGIVSNKFFL